MTTESSWDQLNREFATSVVTKLRENNFIAYFAGGCVRDQLMGLCPKDYDVASNASPEHIVQIFGSRNTHLVGAAFGVACVHKRIAGQGFQVEVATFRKDGEYIDGRRPTSVRYASPQDDAQRRDFTINGMFYDPIESRIHDYVHGEADLANRVIRAIGNPEHRFAEDKLRMVRAVRFAARFQFDVEPATERALIDCSDSLSQISCERLADELSKIAVLPAAAWALDTLHRYRLLGPIWPRLNELWNSERHAKSRNLKVIQSLEQSRIDNVLAAGIWTLQQYDDQVTARFLVEEVAKHLRLSNELAGSVNYLAGNITPVINSADSPWSRLQPIANHPKVHGLLEMVKAVSGAEAIDGVGVRHFEQSIEKHVNDLDPPPLVSGNDLIAHGFRPGTAFKDILQEVRDRQLDSKLTSKEQAIAFLKSAYTGGN